MRNTRSTQLLFELSEPGRRATVVPCCDVPETPLDELLPAAALAAAPPPLPELAEPDMVRHYREPVDAEHVGRHAFLSARLLHDEVQPQAERAAGGAAGHRRSASLPAGRNAAGHACNCCTRCKQMLAEIAGLAAVSLQPAAGAHGELTALMVAAAYFRDRGEKRTKVLAPDSAHGTNPASAAMAGFEAVTGQEHAAGLRRSGRSAREARRATRPCS